ncbi:solute carrier family 2 member 11, like isoform X2 [Hippoglossus hippoglossus]|uniref:solute carrier family 2 member 11, like isoform X2 n=1 Tax=Hippoglossus hippoglossus TaxID=8267 RepID=UPI00148D1684|nr:solute carrier family 2 member 11, like isoform X2 [Hippoglossus hippoglossus]
MSQYLSLLLDCPVVIAAIFITGIGGTFQYGFSVSVLTSPSVFIKELVNKTCQQRYGVSLEQWQVSLIWSFTVSIFCIGGLLGSLVAGPLMSKKQCLLFNNFTAISGALLMLFSQKAMSFEMIMAGRFLYGINAGVSLSAHTMYLVECTPKKLRGMVGVTIGTFISFGKFSGQLLGISELLGTEQRWPWLLAFNGFTALLQLATLPFLPESPSFLLLNRGDHEAYNKALKRLWGDKDYTFEVEEMMKEKAAMQGVRNHSIMELIQNKNVRWQLITILITFIGLQLCGINAVYFYSFDIFREAGIQEGQLRYAALGTGLCEVSTSIACFMIIESTGKKVLLFRGYMAMSATLVLLTITLFLKTHIFWMPYCSMFLIFLFIFCFASGPSGIIAPLPGELFTQPFKSAAYTLACTLNWTGLFLLGMLFPVIVDNMGYFCFLIFLVCCTVCGLFVWSNVPETRHKTALEIAADFDRMHCKSGKSKKQFNEQDLNGFKSHETRF